MDNEVWKPVPNYVGVYEISNKGRLRGLPRTDCRGRFRHGVMFIPGRMSGGYAGVSLSKDGRQRSVLLHQVVARAFLGPVPRGKEVNHKDGDKMNGSVENLEYVTRSEQQFHRYRVLELRAAHGETHYAAKLTSD